MPTKTKRAYRRRDAIPDGVKQRVGDWLKAARERRGKTCAEAAEAVGVDRQNLWQWEQGINAAPIDKLLSLATLYRANLNKLKG